MQFDIENLRRYYASLTDEAIEEIDPADLTEEARQCLAAELAKRVPVEEEAVEIADDDPGVEPDWLKDAACVLRRTDYPDAYPTKDAERARNVLLAAGVPCHISVTPESDEYVAAVRVLVPESLNMKASAALDKEIFNPEQEEGWRTHLAALSDDELAALQPDVICAGMRDWIERFTRVYNQEVVRRGSC